jgi:hypothetical protein
MSFSLFLDLEEEEIERKVVKARLMILLESQMRPLSRVGAGALDLKFQTAKAKDKVAEETAALV